MLVVDACATGPLFLPDETAPPALILDRLLAGPLIVPFHWQMEIGSMLLNAVRRRRITAADRSDSIALLLALDVTIDGQSAEAVWATL